MPCMNNMVKLKTAATNEIQSASQAKLCPKQTPQKRIKEEKNDTDQ